MKRHAEQVLKLLDAQIKNSQEVKEIEATASEVVANWVNPLSGGVEEINGLVYGLVQSGKTGVLTVTGAMGADEGYRCIIILTSDNDPLYDQTLGRAQEAFPGMDIMGKQDFKDATAFIQRIKSGPCAIVTTKNSGLLKTLIENFKKGNVKGLTCLLIDDEADQASLNTKASKDDGQRSAINERISELRQFFEKNTYLQVTATPQALFLQAPGHELRPKFTVLSHPGADYVGGKDFFADETELVREFDIHDLDTLSPGHQPSPSLHAPKSLIRALDTFVVGATYKRLEDVTQNCAFLCHVSTQKADHEYIVRLLRKYKSDIATGLKATPRDPTLVARLRDAYDDLASTHAGVRAARFEDLLDEIQFLAPGTTVKLVNGDTDEDVAVRSPFNLFVGGNKLGRGVTIKNLLVSYYGRNPKRPQADTVLQHARMYGYRRKDIGLLRLFLPEQLYSVFKAISKMEDSLRELIAAKPDEEFRGIYVESGLSPTRKNVLVPGAVGVYSAGGTYNPSQVVRQGVSQATAEIDALLAAFGDKEAKQVSIDLLKKVVALTVPDPTKSEHVWNSIAVADSLGQLANLLGQDRAYIYVDRDRGLVQDRRETQGILEGGEASRVPAGAICLFMLRTKAGNGLEASWWPQVRFPSGRYAFAFAV